MNNSSHTCVIKLKCAILIIENDIIDNLNTQLPETMRCEVFVSYNTNKIINQRNTENYTSKYLDMINLLGLPFHLPRLKVGAVLILLCNLSLSTKMYNRTCFHIVRISQRVT